MNDRRVWGLHKFNANRLPERKINRIFVIVYFWNEKMYIMNDISCFPAPARLQKPENDPGEGLVRLQRPENDPREGLVRLQRPENDPGESLARLQKPENDPREGLVRLQRPENDPRADFARRQRPDNSRSEHFASIRHLFFSINYQ
jgi:hypothetical protein